MSIKIATIQMKMEENIQTNIETALQKTEEAAQKGAQIILLPELFASPYFPQSEKEKFFDWAEEISQHSFVPKFQSLAEKHKVVLPISFFEKAGPEFYNSLAMIDADGTQMGIYRKSHIPDGPGYEEKYYFRPGNTGFKTWNTKYGKIGVGICWDQWFPEAARIMALQGADLLLYPTAIGSEPFDPENLDTSKMWKQAMVGHAICNSCYVAAANRVGKENEINFYGTSFICDFKGEDLSSSQGDEITLYADLDFRSAQTFRASMGFFRDRRPELYSPITR